MLNFDLGGDDHEFDNATAQVAFRFVQEDPKRHMQHPPYGHNPFEHTGTFVSTCRKRTYGDGQILVERFRGRCAPEGVAATCMFSRRLGRFSVATWGHTVSQTHGLNALCLTAPRLPRGCLLTLDVLMGTYMESDFLNQRSLAGILDMCDGNACERVQTTAF